MIAKMFDSAVNLALLPARTAIKSGKVMLSLPAEIDQFSQQLRQVSNEVARELRLLLQDVDAEMSSKASHLSPEQQQQAADLAIQAAEQHLSMAARDVVRALWLVKRSTIDLPAQRSEREVSGGERRSGK